MGVEFPDAFSEIGLKTGFPFLSAICATDINTFASSTYGPFAQDPDAEASLNFTDKFWPLLKTPAMPGGATFDSGGWKLQNCAGSGLPKAPLIMNWRHFVVFPP